MKHQRKKILTSSVRSRLLCIFLSAVLVPVMLYGILVSLSSSRKLEQENYKTYQQMTNQIGTVFSEYIFRTDQTLRSVDNSLAIPQLLRNEIIVTIGLEPDIHFLKDNAYSALKQLADTNSSIYALTVITLSGDSVSCVERNRDTFLEDIDSEYYAPLRNSTGDTVVLPIRESRYAGAMSKNVFTIGCRYLDSSGYTGYIIAECPVEKFEEFCSFVELDPEMNIYILDQTGQLAYTTEEDSSRQECMLAQLKDNLKSGEAKSRIETEDGAYMLVNSPLSDTNWTAYTLIPYSKITANARNMILTFLWLCIVCMLIIALVTYAVSGSFTKPVITLQKAMKSVSEGDLTIRVPEGRSDEFGDLNRGFNNLMDKLDGLIQDVSEAQVRENAAEYQMLQSQINPHFLYNTLDAIRMMAVLSDEQAIADAILHLSTLFRYHTRQSSRLVTIREELEQIRNYLYLQKLRLQDRLEIEYRVQEDVLPYQMPKILLQPILENSFSHGFNNIDPPYRIQITIAKENDSIFFELKDNGCGIPEEALALLRQQLATLKEDERHGIGLYNVNKRLHLYYPDSRGLMVESTEGNGTSISFRIPALNDQKSALFKYDDKRTANVEKEGAAHV